MKRTILLIALTFMALSCKKVTIEERIADIYNYFEENTTAVSLLEHITSNYPARMSGSENNDNAVDYYTLILGKEIKPDKLWTQEVVVPHWEPGESKVVCNPSKGDSFELKSIPLGLSVGTDGEDITAKIVEITSKKSLEKANLKGKIAFFNDPMKKGYYGRATWQRNTGASLAAEKGAVGVIVRSVTDHISDDPHTGVVRYQDSIAQIPAIAISTIAADKLSESLKNDPKLTITLSSTSKRLPDAIGRNVVAEITGRETPDQIILLSAHMDCWFNSEGAHDNAANCVAAVEVLRAFKKFKIKPKNTIRIVLYQDEETGGLSGMREYARIAKEKGETYLFDMEMDSGAGGPKKIMVAEPKPVLEKMNEVMTQYLSPYGLEEISSIKRPDWPLTEEVLAPFYSYRSNTDTYFNYHHSSADNFDAIDPVAFKKGIATITSFVFLMD